MKKLDEIKFTELKENQSYLVIIEGYERFGDVAPKLFKATNKEIINVLNRTFGYDSFVEENGVSNVKDFLQQAQSLNGDGYDCITIYKLK